MELNRKARAQSRNDETLDGDSDLGGSRGTNPRLRRGCVVHRVKRPGHRRRHQSRSLQGSEMTDAGEDLDHRVPELLRIGIEERQPEGVGVLPAAQGHMATDLVEVAEGTCLLYTSPSPRDS